MYGAVTYSLIRRNSQLSHGVLKWVPAREGNIPEDAVSFGNLNGEGGEPMYVGRVNFIPSGDLLPGTIIPSHKVCYVGHDKHEFASADYEVLVNKKPDTINLRWISAKNGNTPEGAVKGGKDATTGGRYFIARACPAPEVTTAYCGKVENRSSFYDEERGSGYAHIPYNGVDYYVKEYEVLCKEYIAPLEVDG